MYDALEEKKNQNLYSEEISADIRAHGIMPFGLKSSWSSLRVRLYVAAF